jgi:hypothetical protein
MFFTLTFPASRAPDETSAHTALRSLVSRLNRRNYLGYYGWVLQRQKNQTLHYHGVMTLPFFTDSLAEFRALIVASGFGVQNKLVVAEKEHARYCSKYISTRLATLAPLRRAYGFSRDFPRPASVVERELLATEYGVVPDDPCDWVPSYQLR